MHVKLGQYVCTFVKILLQVQVIVKITVIYDFTCQYLELRNKYCTIITCDYIEIRYKQVASQHLRV